MYSMIVYQENFPDLSEFEFESQFVGKVYKAEQSGSQKNFAQKIDIFCLSGEFLLSEFEV